jgi:2-isopropylmalate synthase
MATRNAKKSQNSEFVHLYDTTLRDGTQRKGLSLSLADKLKLTELIDRFGIPYIEGGWPGSNPKDLDYFKKVRSLKLEQAKIVAFGSTCRVGADPADDKNIQALLDAQTPAVTIVGKASKLHVTKILQTTLDENCRIIYESVRFLKRHVEEVIFDAEHFFDGYLESPEYSLKAITAACDAGADWIVLCDTNGRSLPETITDVISVVKAKVADRIGIHTHNDSDLAVANALAAVNAGARHIQGTINGYGERCGNANLISIIPALQLKMGMQCIAPHKIAGLTELSHAVSEIANLQPDPYAPYVGSFAFAHKAGLHVAAVEKLASSYEHVDPNAVGNTRHVVVSELSGRGNIRMLASGLGVPPGANFNAVLEQVKELENRGFQFENAEGTVELMLRRSAPNYEKCFELIDMMVVTSHLKGLNNAEAIVKVLVKGTVFHTAAEGNGPVNALDQALRKALVPSYPELEHVRLADYKVRILDHDRATGAVARVCIEATCREATWSTVGCSTNIIEASYQALADSFELYLLRAKEKQAGKKLKEGVA